MKKELNIDTIDLEAFKSLDHLQTFIDTNAVELLHHLEITNLYRKYKHHTTIEEEKTLVQYELDAWHMNVKSHSDQAVVRSTGKSGLTSKKYPDHDFFTKSAYDYLLSRATAAKAGILAAHYYHVLWLAPPPVKNRQYARSAAKRYIDSIRMLYVECKNDPDNFQGAFASSIVEKLIDVVSESKELVDETKILMEEIISDENIFPFYLKHAILEDMLEQQGLFKPVDFANALPLYEKQIKAAAKPGEHAALAEYHLPQALKIAQKMNRDVRPWHERIGDAFLQWAESETKEERNWLKLGHYESAIRAYQMAGAEDKKSDTERRYTELKPNVKLDTFEFHPDQEMIEKLKAAEKSMRDHAEKLLKAGPDIVYGFLSGGNYLPNAAQVAGRADTISSMNLFRTIQFDRNKNIVSPGEFSEETSRAYYLAIRQQTIPMLHNIIIPGIISGTLTVSNILKHLAHHTWMGAPLAFTDLGGKPKKIEILSLVVPSIMEFFQQIQAWNSNKYEEPSFMLCIDSLCMKFETMFRQFCMIANISTSVPRKKGIQEVYIHEVLENDNFKKYFDEDEIQFFKYLFDNTGGLNMRNNIAHGFYHYEDYGHEKMLLMLAALFRLAKHNVKPVSSEEKENDRSENQ
jgi:hypothetical protein